MKKTKKIGVVFTGAVIAALFVYGTTYFTAASWRAQLPPMPDTGSYTAPVVEQLVTARRKAILVTTAGTLGDLGMAYHSCADYVNAAKCYQLAVQKNNHQWKWNYYLGYLSLEQGQSRMAVENFEQVILKDPSNQFAWYYAGEAYRAQGINDAAIPLFKKVLAASTGNTENATDREAAFPLQTYALFQLARIYIAINRSDTAATILKTLLADQPAFGPAYRSLAAISSAVGDTLAAKNYSTRANDQLDYSAPPDSRMDQIALLSRSDQYLLKQVEDALHSSNYRWALTLCNHALPYFPNNRELISIAVVENFRQGADARALSYLDKHFDYFSNDAKELMDVTDILYSHQKLPEAIRYFEQVKKLMPNNSSLATWLFERGKQEEAMAMMNDLIKRHPADEKILADEIRLLVATGDEEMADKYLRLLKGGSPTAAQTLQASGLMAEKHGNLNSAGLAYEAAADKDPTDLIFARRLIDFYIRQKNWPLAVRHFRSALQQYPNEPSLLEGLGRLLIACPDGSFRDPQEGILYSERAFLNYRSPYETRLSAGKNLATVYLSLGDKKNTTKYINQTIQLAEKGKQAKEYIAYFHKLTGN